MPRAAKHPCTHPGCPRLVERGQSRCAEHTRQARQAHEKSRPTSRQRGYDSRWDKASRTYLDANRFCVACLEAGRETRSKVVDHIIPHKGEQRLFWDKNNWQALCKPCHDRKTATEDGGWGRGG